MERQILIVDDSAVMRKNLRSILTGAGYRVVAEAVNGDEAVKAYRLHQPDLVTMDVTMPVMNGIDAVRDIVAYDPKAVILVISAFDQRSMLFEALEKGAKRYIVKPITADKLLTAVGDLLAASDNTSRGSDKLPQLPHDASGANAVAAAMPDTAPTPASIAAPAEPIRIENRNSTFCLQVTANMVEASLTAVRPALQGLLLIQPMRMAVDFGSLMDVEEVMLQLLDELLQPVLAAGGHLVYITDVPALRSKLQSRRADIAVVSGA